MTTFLNRRNLLAVCLLVLMQQAVAQTVRCRIVDRKGSGIDGVEVKVGNVGPHISFDFGEVLPFHLSSAFVPGTRIEFMVRKQDMEPVDENELSSFVPRDDNERIKIRMARKGEKEAEIKKLIETATQQIQHRFKQEMQRLKAQMKQSQGSQATTLVLQEQVASLTRERDQALEMAKTIAGQLYKVDLTVVSQTYQQAYALFTEGKVEQAQALIYKANLHQQLLMARQAEEQVKIRQQEVAKARTQIASTATLQARLYVTQLRFDSAAVAYEFALEADSAHFGNTFETANFFYNQNNPTKALHYYRKLLTWPLSEVQEGHALNKLGLVFHDLNNLPEAEQMYLHSLKIRERLAGVNPALFEPDLAMVLNNLGILYRDLQEMQQAEQMYLRALEIYERLAKANPSQFDPGRARVLTGLGNLYSDVQKMQQAEQLYLRALEIYERLIKTIPAQFEPNMALTFNNLGVLYQDLQKMQQAEQMYLRALEIYERLAKANPSQFDPGRARGFTNLGNLYSDVQKMQQAEQLYLHALEIYERLIQTNPAQFEPDMALLLNNLGLFYATQKNYEKAHQHYNQALTLRKKAILEGKEHFLSELRRVSSNLKVLRDSLFQHHNYQMVVAIQQGLADCLYSLQKIGKLPEEAARAYASLSWFCLFNKQYYAAESAALKALSIDSTQTWIKTNLAHAYLLQGNYQEAEALYLQLKPLKDAEGNAYSTILQQDLESLQAAGIQHADMTKVHQLLKN